MKQELAIVTNLKSYEAPIVDTIEIYVEQGFAVSGTAEDPDADPDGIF